MIDEEDLNSDGDCGTYSTQNLSSNMRTKQIRIEGWHYRLSEVQIRSWLGIYRVVRGDVAEEAIKDPTNGTLLGTGTYLTKIELTKRLPNMIPMYGLRVTMSHYGISKICKKCFNYHKREIGCVKRSWNDYVSQFKAENESIA
jgi:hypothetical protein